MEFHTRRAAIPVHCICAAVLMFLLSAFGSLALDSDQLITQYIHKCLDGGWQIHHARTVRERTPPLLI